MKPTVFTPLAAMCSAMAVAIRPKFCGVVNTHADLSPAGGTGASTILDAYLPRMLSGDGPVSFTLALLRKDLRLNFAVHNLTNRKYWNWSDVQGLASNPTPPLLPVVDAYTQPGRHFNASLVAEF